MIRKFFSPALRIFALTALVCVVLCGTAAAQTTEGQSDMTPASKTPANSITGRVVTAADGVILLARRMTIAGIPSRKIEAMLAGLGVADPQAAVRHALYGSVR